MSIAGPRKLARIPGLLILLFRGETDLNLSTPCNAK